jgi:hypothetical protein
VPEEMLLAFNALIAASYAVFTALAVAAAVVLVFETESAN